MWISPLCEQILVQKLQTWFSVQKSKEAKKETCNLNKRCPSQYK